MREEREEYRGLPNYLRGADGFIGVFESVNFMLHALHLSTVQRGGCYLFSIKMRDHQGCGS